MRANCVHDEEWVLCPDYARAPEDRGRECDGTCTDWVAHTHPERPLGYGAWICDCDACRASCRAAAKAQPGAKVVLKTGYDRFEVSVATLPVSIPGPDWVDELLEHPDDYLREVYVSTGGPNDTRSPYNCKRCRGGRCEVLHV